MAKTKSAYFCQSCGYETAKWLGKCPSCNSWNTFVEEIIEKPTSNIPAWQPSGSSKKLNKPNKVTNIESSTEHK
ncbi:MAG: DNA repair protein RadA, partial [Pedobacter sp.]|nr:DNA repair protein RadA [Pedobacter sp.]